MAQLSVRFWGVRGSLATPGRATARYGGNTPCIEIEAGDERLVFDMGSGLRELGNALAGSATGAGGSKVTFFLSHYHWDHILGLPFFKPAYDPRSALVVYGATRLGRSVRDILAGQMINPYFPVSLAEMRAGFDFRTVEDKSVVELGDTRVTVRELAHPGGALGFRVDRGGASVVYATDFEHGCGGDEALAELCQGADLLIYDATYTVPEYARYRGWGHSTWAEGVRFARDCGVKRLALFHHDPSRDDRGVDEIVRQARERFPRTEAAREGRVIHLGAESRRRGAPATPRTSSKAKPSKGAASKTKVAKTTAAKTAKSSASKSAKAAASKAKPAAKRVRARR